MLSLSTEDNEMLKNPVVVDNQGREIGTATRKWQERHFVADEREIGRLFTRYFNNKMTLPLFLIQARNVKTNRRLVETVQDFLGDIYRHMLEERLQERYRLVFKWLHRFFEMLPDVSAYQRNKAKTFIRVIYGAFGLCLKDEA